ncbi:centrosomal protein POC5-like isoform X2 [Mercenaria mercenaria]|uniref:centrosomal protein POC5-like isoform X2 n=1 Tax=Mercenaria mercenaria TaxID=6596 RepID=UPI00234EA157|nr:centrosomal protein POC5-like isoform X2 [Mercenaria mercenaria]
MSTISDLSVPDIPPLSPGSSVSTRLQDEYDELLKFAVVVPKYDPAQIPQTLTDAKDSFMQASSQSVPRRTDRRLMDEDELSEATDVTPINVRPSPREGLPDFVSKTTPRERLPDFGQSPIMDEDRPHDPIPSHYFARVPSTNSDMNGNNTKVNGEYERVYTATVDPDVSKMENMMDQWCLDLKRNVLAEFSQSKIRIVEQGRLQLVKEQEKHASEKMKLLDEINSLKELLATYEKSIERKDQVISNLTHAMQKQKDKNEMMRTFCEWKMKHNDFKRETFCTMIAKKHHQRSLQRKVWDAWHSVIETKWRVRVEKACQAKAQEVCIHLTNDYEAKLSAANEELDSVRSEVAQMHKERERYEEMMKKAFMRGVCALNLEAMTIFHNNEEKENRDIGNGQIPDDISENMKDSIPEKDYSIPKTLPHEYAQHERIVTSEGSRPSTVTQGRPMSSKSTGKPGISKALTTKVTSKIDSRMTKGVGSQVLAPPMTSVTVERHQPVSKQTMPHAVAGKYPRSHAAPSSDRRKLAGQGHLPSNLQTVKHVE